MLDVVHVIVITRSSQHTAHWNQGRMDNMRSKIVNALLLGEVASPRTVVEKCIGNEEDSLIPTFKETLHKIQGHELRGNTIRRFKCSHIRVVRGL